MQIIPLVPCQLIFFLDVLFESGEIRGYVGEEVWEEFCGSGVAGRDVGGHVGFVFVCPAEVCAGETGVLAQIIVVCLAF